MLKAIFNWFGHKNPAPQSQAPVVQPEAAPYKVEAPVPVAPTATPEPVAPAPQRAKNNQGKFVADNPATPKNEAWKDGKAPAAVKAAPKKTAAKKPAAPAKPKKPQAPKKST